MGGFLSGETHPNDAFSVLRRKTAVCEGYSEMFAALCKYVNRNRIKRLEYILDNDQKLLTMLKVSWCV